MNDLRLEGCSPERLGGYLKGLAVFRLLHEQRDDGVRADWAGGTLRLHTKLTEEELIAFFAAEYVPTPVAVPWREKHFLSVCNVKAKPPFSLPPRGSTLLKSFLYSKAARLEEYRGVVKAAITGLKTCMITDSKQFEDDATMLAFLQRLRAEMPDRFVEWLDAAVVLGASKSPLDHEPKTTFSALVGTLQGNDGRVHLSDNFMMNLWVLLPEFDEQRKRPKRGRARDTLACSKALLTSALFGAPTTGLSRHASSLYDPGGTGNVNAGQGPKRDPVTNPWNFVLALEGCVCLGGAISRRAGASRAAATFPFQVRISAGTTQTGSASEQADREIWLPLWSQAASYPDVRQLVGEGRAIVGRRPASHSGEFARAVAELGIDRKIDSFERFGIVKGRVGGDHYSAAVPFGRFDVTGRRDAELLRDADGWLDGFRTACRTKAEKAKADPPARFPSALRRIDAAVFDFCKHGGADRMANVLCALGSAEREVAVGDLPPEDRRTRRPLSGLSPAWVAACDDGTPEVRLARAVAFLGPAPLRANLEPVEFGNAGWVWAERSGSVVWSSGSLARNLGAILTRRTLEGRRGEGSAMPVSLADVSHFLAREADDARLGELIWGFALTQPPAEALPQETEPVEPLPRSYALLKLTLLPGRLKWAASGGRVYLRHLRKGDDGAEVRPDPATLARLRVGDVRGAYEAAVRRLRAAGFVPLPGPSADGATRSLLDLDSANLPPERLLASLLFPITDRGVRSLGRVALRAPPLEAIA